MANTSPANPAPIISDRMPESAASAPGSHSTADAPPQSRGRAAAFPAVRVRRTVWPARPVGRRSEPRRDVGDVFRAEPPDGAAGRRRRWIATRPVPAGRRGSRAGGVGSSSLPPPGSLRRRITARAGGAGRRRRRAGVLRGVARAGERHRPGGYGMAISHRHWYRLGAGQAGGGRPPSPHGVRSCQHIVALRRSLGGCGRERSWSSAVTAVLVEKVADARQCTADGLRSAKVVGVFGSRIRRPPPRSFSTGCDSRSSTQPTGQRGATASQMLAQVRAATCRATDPPPPAAARCTERSGATSSSEHLGLSGLIHLTRPPEPKRPSIASAGVM